MLRQHKVLLFALIMILVSGCHQNNSSIYSGYIEGNFTYVSSQASGVLNYLKVSRGEVVKKGDLLFQLELTPEYSDFLQAKAHLEQAKASWLNLMNAQKPSEIAAIKAQQEQVKSRLDFALKTVSRFVVLNKKGYVDKQQLDQATANANDLSAKLKEISRNLETAQSSLGRSAQIQAAKSEVDAATAALSKANWMLSQTQVHAPVSGYVFDAFYRAGEVIPAVHPVVAILSPDNIYAVFYVPEKLFSSIKMGGDVKITCDGCSKQIPAKISYISSEAEYTPQVFYTEKSRSKFVFKVEARMSLANAAKMHPGQPVDVTIYPPLPPKA